MNSANAHTCAAIRRIAEACLAASLAVSLAACAPGSDAETDGTPQADSPAVLEDPADSPVENATGGDAEASSREGASQMENAPAAEPLRVSMTADGLAATVVLEDCEAARAFAKLLPLELDMRDVNGNEKFARLDGPLPAEDRASGRVETGDVMLYGGDGVVVFYESFETPYGYTRLGRVEDPSALAAIAGAASVHMAFEAV